VREKALLRSDQTVLGGTNMTSFAGRVKIVNQGTARFPIPARLVGRVGTIVESTAQGRVLRLAVHDRKTPLRVTSASVQYI